MDLQFIVSFVFSYLSICNFCYGENFGTERTCILKSVDCTERRLKNHIGIKEVLPIFQDALYHYCLDLMDCQKGREQICKNIGYSELDYPDPNLRRRLIQQCDDWNIPIKLARQGDMTAHYVFSRVSHQANVTDA